MTTVKKSYECFRGFTLIETVIALGIVAVVAMAVIRLLNGSSKIIQTSEKMMVASEIGDWAYSIMKKQDSLLYTATRPGNDIFLNCYQNRICPAETSFNLFQNERKVAFAGTEAAPALYTEKGERCLDGNLGPECNVAVTAYFRGGTFLQEAAASESDYIVMRVDLRFKGMQNPIVQYHHMVTLKPYTYSADQMCNPGSSDRASTIVNGFNLGALRCGIDI